jgi:hypothetical protein
MEIMNDKQTMAAAAAVAPLDNAKKRSSDHSNSSTNEGTKRLKHDPTTDCSADSFNENRELPAPFFYYRDASRLVDPDPLSALTPPGRVPMFPAKMHAILSQTEFKDIVSWADHGRSWRILKPREFEIKILPQFMEHAKFSSFLRQANGWGFRRLYVAWFITYDLVKMQN